MAWPTARTWPTRRTFGALALVVVVFAAWISLVPFNFEQVAPPDIPARIVGIGQPFPAHVSRSDLVSNAAVFALFGFLGAAAFGLDRYRLWERALAVAAIGLASAAVSATIELAQVFLPDRTSSLVDVGSQSCGALLGALGWSLAGQPLVDWIRQGVVRRERPSAVTRLLLAYTAGLVLYRLYPFDFTADLGDLAGKVRSGRIALVPFQSLPEFPAGLAHLVARALTAVPVGALAMLLGVKPGTRRSLLRALAYATLGLAALECLKALAMSHYADPGNVILGIAGALAGALIVTRVRVRTTRDETGAAGINWFGWIALAWALIVTLYWWYPLNFDVTPAAVKHGIQRVSLMPFANYYWTTPERVLADVPGKLLLAAPFGLLLALAARKTWPGMPRRLLPGLVLVVSVALWGVLEAGQILLPTRTPDVTDVIVPAATACLAAWLVTIGAPIRDDEYR